MFSTMLEPTQGPNLLTRDISMNIEDRDDILLSPSDGLEESKEREGKVGNLLFNSEESEREMGVGYSYGYEEYMGAKYIKGHHGQDFATCGSGVDFHYLVVADGHGPRGNVVQILRETDWERLLSRYDDAEDLLFAINHTIASQISDVRDGSTLSIVKINPGTGKIQAYWIGDSQLVIRTRKTRPPPPRSRPTSPTTPSLSPSILLAPYPPNSNNNLKKEKNLNFERTDSDTNSDKSDTTTATVATSTISSSSKDKNENGPDADEMILTETETETERGQGGGRVGEDTSSMNTAIYNSTTNTTTSAVSTTTITTTTTTGKTTTKNMSMNTTTATTTATSTTRKRTGTTKTEVDGEKGGEGQGGIEGISDFDLDEEQDQSTLEFLSNSTSNSTSYSSQSPGFRPLLVDKVTLLKPAMHNKFNEEEVRRLRARNVRTENSKAPLVLSPTDITMVDSLYFNHQCMGQTAKINLTRSLGHCVSKNSNRPFYRSNSSNSRSNGNLNRSEVVGDVVYATLQQFDSCTTYYDPMKDHLEVLVASDGFWDMVADTEVHHLLGEMEQAWINKREKIRTEEGMKGEEGKQHINMKQQQQQQVRGEDGIDEGRSRKRSRTEEREDEEEGEEIIIHENQKKQEPDGYTNNNTKSNNNNDNNNKNKYDDDNNNNNNTNPLGLEEEDRKQIIEDFYVHFADKRWKQMWNYQYKNFPTQRTKFEVGDDIGVAVFSSYVFQKEN